MAIMRASKFDRNAKSTKANIVLPRIAICLRGSDQNEPLDDRI
jgi:hypothetical protein